MFKHRDNDDDDDGDYDYDDGDDDHDPPRAREIVIVAAWLTFNVLKSTISRPVVCFQPRSIFRTRRHPKSQR